MAIRVHLGRGTHGVGRTAVVVVVLAAVGLALVGLASGLFTSERPTKIDTSDVAVSTLFLPTTAADTVSTNALQVAIGAMISPDKTRQQYGDLLKLVGRRMGRSVDIVQKKTYAEVNGLLERKALDFALICSVTPVCSPYSWRLSAA